MQEAFAAGINFFDNAEVYAFGEAERLMGRVIKRAGWKRSDLVLSTKLFWGGKPGERTVNDVGLSRKHLLEGIDASLARLQLAYVDIVFCHRPDPHTPIEETVRAMDYIVNSGKAFYWGTSEWSAREISEAHAVARRLGLIAPTVEQPQYNMLHRQRFEVEYEPVYQQTGMGTTVWSALASGVLAGKYNHGFPEGSRLALPSYAWLKKQFVSGKRHGRWEDVLSRVRALAPIAAQLGCTQAQLSIAWCLKNPRVSTVILGAKSSAQLRENLLALAVLPLLTPQVMARIESVLRTAPEQPRDWTK